MAIFHMSISNVSRAKGSSSCATLSYISAEKVHEDRTSQTYSYRSRAERVVFHETILPADAPAVYQNPQILFNDLENFEKSENARTAKKIEVALPKEIDLGKQKDLLERYIKSNITSKGYAAVFAIHHDKQGNNPHAHILVANRPLESGKFAASKEKKIYALDDQGNKIPVLDPKTGKQKIGSKGRKMWKRVSVTKNILDSKDFLVDLRKSWAENCNQLLTADKQIDHRSHKDRGLDVVPTIHEGHAARQIEKQGIISDICEQNREIKAYNATKAAYEKLRQEIAAIEKEIAALQKTVTPEPGEGEERLFQGFMLAYERQMHFSPPKEADGLTLKHLKKAGYGYEEQMGIGMAFNSFLRAIKAQAKAEDMLICDYVEERVRIDYRVIMGYLKEGFKALNINPDKHLKPKKPNQNFLSR